MWKNHTLSSYTLHERRSISTKFCMMIEDLRAIILLCKLFFGSDRYSLPARVVENLAENAPTEVNGLYFCQLLS